jgi:hypothetical protein
MSTCETYETYTIKIDSKFAPSSNSFVGYINIPLRNVVKAELLSASISANVATSNVIYVYAPELESKFNDSMDVQTAITTFSSNTNPINLPTSNIGPIPTGYLSNLIQLRTSIVCMPADPLAMRTTFTVASYFPTDIEFIEPIRQIQQLTISLYNESGLLLPVNGPTFLTFRFTCFRPNKCKY